MVEKQKSKGSRVRLGLSFFGTYLVISAVFHWREIWNLSRLDTTLVGLIIEAGVAAALFALVYPVVAKAYAGHMKQKKDES